MDVESGKYEIPMCNCGSRSVLKHSWTPSNPGRRFFGCQKYGGGNGCGFFLWFDAPTPEHLKGVISGLLKRVREFEAKKQKDKSRQHILKWVIRIVVVFVLLYWLLL